MELTARAAGDSTSQSHYIPSSPPTSTLPGTPAPAPHDPDSAPISPEREMLGIEVLRAQGMTNRCAALSGLGNRWASAPRALPWAGLYRPVGARALGVSPRALPWTGLCRPVGARALGVSPHGVAVGRVVSPRWGGWIVPGPGDPGRGGHGPDWLTTTRPKRLAVPVTESSTMTRSQSASMTTGGGVVAVCQPAGPADAGSEQNCGR